MELLSNLSPIYQGEKPGIDSEVPSSPDVTLFKSCGLDDFRELQDAPDDEYGSFNGLGAVSMAGDARAWLARHISVSYDTSDSTTTSATSDGDAVTKCIDVTWHSPPSGSSPLSSSPLHDCYPCACSQDVHQALAQQGFLLHIFHEELRRIIPSDQNYSSTWLEDVDPRLVLSPARGYEDLCWRSAVSDTHTRPLTVSSEHEPVDRLGIWDTGDTV